MHPSTTRAQVYQMDDPCYHIGGGIPQIDLKIKNLMCGISRSPTQDTSGTIYKWYLQVVSFQQSMRSSMRSSPFLEINDKGGEIVQRYESLRERLRRRSRSWTWTWTWTKREQH